MLPPFAHHATSAQIGQKSDDRRAHGRDSARTLVATSGYQQHLTCPANLSFAEPRFGTITRIGCRRERLSEIQSILGTERSLVERLPHRVKRNFTGSHSGVRARRVSGNLRFYLHCAGAPAGRPNAVVTAILQPSGVFTKMRSE